MAASILAKIAFCDELKLSDHYENGNVSVFLACSVISYNDCHQLARYFCGLAKLPQVNAHGKRIKSSPEHVTRGDGEREKGIYQNFHTFCRFPIYARFTIIQRWQFVKIAYWRNEFVETFVRGALQFYRLWKIIR